MLPRTWAKSFQTETQSWKNFLLKNKRENKFSVIYAEMNDKQTFHIGKMSKQTLGKL